MGCEAVDGTQSHKRNSFDRDGLKLGCEDSYFCVQSGREFKPVSLPHSEASVLNEHLPYD